MNELAEEFMRQFPNANPVNQPKQFEYFVKLFLYSKNIPFKIHKGKIRPTVDTYA